MKPCALFLFNLTDAAVLPFLQAGITCVSCDIQHPKDCAIEVWSNGARHIRTNRSADWGPLQHLLRGCEVRPALIISFAPCTNLTVSNNRKISPLLAADPHYLDNDVARVKLASELGAFYGCPTATENPAYNRLGKLWRAPDYKFNPCDYAGYCEEGPHPLYPDVLPPQDRYNKYTALWTSGGYVMPEFDRMEPLGKVFPGHAKLGGSSMRTKNIRSATPRGWARASFEANKHLFSDLLPLKLVDKDFLLSILP
jgi:hypothetical protein